MADQRILVVEDDEDLGVLMLHQLKKAGFEGLLATDGVQAMQLLKQVTPQLILLDFMFPAGGVSFHQRLRSSAFTVTTPILIVTSVPSETVLQSLKTDANTFYIGKPYKQEEFVALIRAILDGKAEPLHAPAVAAPAAASPTAAKMSGRTALIADDDEMIVAMLRYALEKEGYRVEAVLDGTALKERLKLDDEDEDLKVPKPDVIILDIMMPGVDGFTLNLQLQHNPRTKDIPVLVVTARPGMKQMFESAANVIGVLGKPLDMAVARGLIDKALGKPAS